VASSSAALLWPSWMLVTVISSTTSRLNVDIRDRLAFKRRWALNSEKQRDDLAISGLKQDLLRPSSTSEFAPQGALHRLGVVYDNSVS
jgi:hypothetical protein